MANATLERARTKRKRETYPSCELYHVWAHQQTDYGRANGASVYFRGETIYSYGEHFPMARLIIRGGKPVAALITTRSYSSTTSGHQSRTLAAVRHLENFHVPDVKASHGENLKAYGKRIVEATAAAGKARVNLEQRITELRRAVAEANRYAEFFGLKTRFKEPADFNPAALRAIAEDERRKASEKTRLAELRQLKAARERYAVELAEYTVKLEAWLTGDESRFPRVPVNPDDRNADSDQVRLRVRGSRIESSMGAVFEVKAAKPILALVRRLGSERKEFPDIEVDGYRGVVIDYSTKIVSVGCHDVSFDEVERIAKQLKL